MRVKILHSGSDGNCVNIRDSNGNEILLDCGIPYREIAKSTNISMLDFVIVSHEHNDHQLSIGCFEKFYIPTYTWANCVAGKFIDTPHWKIFPIELVHNVKCFGFYIYSKIDKKKILYCTDTKFLPKINGEIDVAIIDCNYCDEYVYELMYKGVEVGIGYKNHCSIETVQEWLQGRNDKISYFVAYHLSNSGLTTPQIIKDKIGDLVGNLIMSAPNTTFEV